MHFQRPLAVLLVMILAVSAAACSTPLRSTAGLDSVQSSAESARENATVRQVRVPGSRVPRRVDSDQPLSGVGASPATIYSREALDASGRTDTAAALRELDPAAGGG